MQSMPCIIKAIHLDPSTYSNHCLLPPKQSFGLCSPKKSIHTKKLIPCRANASTGTGDRDRNPLETAFKLYSTFKNGNLQDLSELVGDECRSSNKFIPIIYLINGKKMMSELLSSLMEFMGNHMEIVIRPISKHDGPEVGIKWQIAWKGTDVPLGKNNSFYISHAYQGKMFIRNFKTMFEPLMNMEPLRLKLVEIVESNLERIAPQLSGKRKAAFIYCSLMLLSMAMTLLLWKKTFM